MISGLLGFLTGAMLFGLTYQQVFPQISKITNSGMVLIPDMWNLNPYLFVLAFALLSLFLFYLIDRVGMQRKDKLDQKDEDN